MNRIKTGIKLQVTPEQSEQVQEICFANGIVWKSGSKQVWLEYKPYLFISNQYITYCDTAEFYNSKMNKEVDAKFFIRTQGTCIEENQEQELKQNIEEEQMYFLNTEMKKKNNEHKDVKEYLVAEGLYDRVMEIEWDYGEEPNEFSELFLWDDVDEGFGFWNDLDDELIKLGIEKNVESLIQDYKAKQEQELKQNIEEEQMKDNEVETYKDVKEYLVAKGLYDRVMEIEWGELDEYESFSALYIWMDTKEGASYWSKVDKELRDLDIHMNIESLVQEYKAKQGKEFIQYLETQPEEVVDEAPEQPAEAKPKQYLCYVQGKALPKHIHKTLEQAKQEAQRLCRKELAKVSVLEVVAEYEAEVLVKEVL